MIAVESEAAQADTEKSAVALRSDGPVAMALGDARLMVEQMATSDTWQKMFAMEERVEAHPAAYRELITHHIFTPGLYVREVVMFAGHFIATRIHLTEHPFVVSMGRVLVWTEDKGVIEVGAPFTGITKPGTRRFIYIIEDCIWSTFHVNPDNETDPQKIMDRITYNNATLRTKTRARK